MADKKTIVLGDVIESIKRFFSYLRSQFMLIALCATLGLVLPLIYRALQKPAYAASTTFILEEKSVGGGGLAGIASQVGLDLGSLGSGSSLFTGDNILDIIKSRVIIEKVLLTPISGSAGKTLADLYLDFSGLGERLPAPVSFAILSDSAVAPVHSVYQDSVLYVMYEQIAKKNVSVDRLNKKGSIFKIVTVSQNQVFSKNFAERLLKETTTYYVNVKTSTAAANVKRLQARGDSLLRVLNAKSYNAASFQILDPNVAFKSMSVPAEVSSRDKSIVFSIYAEVTKNLEMSRIALVSQTPVIQLLDVPKYPLMDDRKSYLFLGFAGLFAGLLVGFFLCLYLYTDK
ncbi:Wzz/FepE/Etk N-terminal domain-containing protein [Aquirufa novilacunae]|uniref:Wzz/FepE/Etk N-terminal domain-containing protein n=1 Tax=Aquirufa novilacunae TaxID=3139305 RepID=A0ABW8U2Q2_9BACT